MIDTCPSCGTYGFPPQEKPKTAQRIHPCCCCRDVICIMCYVQHIEEKHPELYRLPEKAK